MHFPSNKEEYAALNQDSASSDSLLERLDSTTSSVPVRPRWWSRRVSLSLSWPAALSVMAIWVAITIGLSVVISALWHPPQLHGIELKSYEFAPARRFIEKQVQRFTGTAIFESEEIAYREVFPGAKEYIGNSSEVQQNWKELIKDRYFYITEEEAKAQWPKDYKQYYHNAAGWSAGLDVFHTLHCVNRIRHALNQARNGTVHQHNATSFDTYHVDHCLDIIRQSIQCSADLTPIPERRFPGVNDFIDSDQKHVCRNIWTLRKFLELRRKRDEATVARIERETGRKFVEEESAMGAIGFPDRKGHEAEYRPKSIKVPPPSR